MTPEEREQIARMFDKATRIMDRLATIALRLEARISVLEEKINQITITGMQP